MPKGSSPRKNNKKDHTTESSTGSTKPLVELDENDQLDIINKTGVLHKVKERQKQVEAEDEPVFLISVIMALPLVMFHAILDYTVHMQYGFEHLFTFERVLTRQGPLIPALIVLIYVTSLFKKSKIAQTLYAIVAFGAGCYLIHINTVDDTFGEMLKSPGLAVIWIYLIIQLDLTPAILSLIFTVVYYYREQIAQVWNGTYTLPSNLKLSEDL